MVSIKNLKNGKAGHGSLITADISKYAATLVFLLFGALCIFPFIFMISSSFKLNAYIFEFPFKIIPSPAVLDGYVKLFESGSLFGRWYINTIVLVLITLTLRIFIVGITAYSLSRLNYKGRDVLFFIFTLTLMVPQDILLVPRYIVLTYLHLINSMWAIALLYTFEFFLIFMVRQFYLTIPKELSEAAIIDGCSHFRVFYSIILPLTVPAMVTLVIFTFVWEWNDFTSPFIFISNTAKQMLTVGIRSFATEHTTDYATQMAGASILSIPIVVVFLFAQRYFVAGIATSGIKG